MMETEVIRYANMYSSGNEVEINQSLSFFDCLSTNGLSECVRILDIVSRMNCSATVCSLVITVCIKALKELNYEAIETELDTITLYLDRLFDAIQSDTQILSNYSSVAILGVYKKVCYVTNADFIIFRLLDMYSHPYAILSLKYIAQDINLKENVAEHIFNTAFDVFAGDDMYLKNMFLEVIAEIIEQLPELHLQHSEEEWVQLLYEITLVQELRSNALKLWTLYKFHGNRNILRALIEISIEELANHNESTMESATNFLVLVLKFYPNALSNVGRLFEVTLGCYMKHYNDEAPSIMEFHICNMFEYIIEIMTSFFDPIASIERVIEFFNSGIPRYQCVSMIILKELAPRMNPIVMMKIMLCTFEATNSFSNIISERVMYHIVNYYRSCLEVCTPNEDIIRSLLDVIPSSSCSLFINILEYITDVCLKESTYTSIFVGKLIDICQYNQSASCYHILESINKLTQKYQIDISVIHNLIDIFIQSDDPITFPQLSYVILDYTQKTMEYLDPRLYDWLVYALEKHNCYETLSVLIIYQCKNPELYPYATSWIEHNTDSHQIALRHIVKAFCMALVETDHDSIRIPSMCFLNYYLSTESDYATRCYVLPMLPYIIPRLNPEDEGFKASILSSYKDLITFFDTDDAMDISMDTVKNILEAFVVLFTPEISINPNEWKDITPTIIRSLEFLDDDDKYSKDLRQAVILKIVQMKEAVSEDVLRELYSSGLLESKTTLTLQNARIEE